MPHDDGRGDPLRRPDPAETPCRRGRPRARAGGGARRRGRRPRRRPLPPRSNRWACRCRCWRWTRRSRCCAGGELELIGRLWVSSNNAMLGVVRGGRRRGGVHLQAGRRRAAAVRLPRRHPGPARGGGVRRRRRRPAGESSRPPSCATGRSGEGMLQLWIRTDPDVDPVALVNASDPRLRRIAVFDAAVNNTDRKAGHLLPVPGGHIYGVDHGVTFSPVPKLRTVLWAWRGEPFAEEELGGPPRAPRRGSTPTSAATLRELLDPDRGRGHGAPHRPAPRRGRVPPARSPLARAALAAGLTPGRRRGGGEISAGGSRSPIGGGTMGACDAGTAGATRRTTRTLGAGGRRLPGEPGSARARRPATRRSPRWSRPSRRRASSPSTDLRLTTDPETPRPARPRPVLPGPRRAPLRPARRGPGRGRATRPTTPTSARLIDHARAVGARLIPYGGGTSVVGGVSARPSRRPADHRRPRRRSSASASVDERSGLVTVRRRDHRPGPRDARSAAAA